MRNEGRGYLSRLCGNCHWRVSFCVRERWRKRESKFVFCFREVVYTRSLTEGWAAHGTFSNCGKADLPCRPVHSRDPERVKGEQWPTHLSRLFASSSAAPVRFASPEKYARFLIRRSGRARTASAYQSSGVRACVE